MQVEVVQLFWREESRDRAPQLLADFFGLGKATSTSSRQLSVARRQTLELTPSRALPLKMILPRQLCALDAKLGLEGTMAALGSR